MTTRRAYKEAWQLHRMMERVRRGQMECDYRHNIRGLFRELPFAVQCAAIASYANRDAWLMYDGASIRQSR